MKLKAYLLGLLLFLGACGGIEPTVIKPIPNSTALIPSDLYSDLQDFSKKMGISYKEIAKDDMPEWLNNDGNREIVGIAAIVAEKKWADNILSSITIALAKITSKLRTNIPINTMTFTKQISKMSFESEPTFNVRQMIQIYTDSSGTAKDIETTVSVSFQQPIFVHNEGIITYYAEEVNHETKIKWTKPPDISANKLSSLINFIKTLGIEVTDFSYSAGENPMFWSRVTLDIEKANAKGLEWIKK